MAAVQAANVDWEAEEARSRETAMKEIAKCDPESELNRDPARQKRQRLHALNLSNLREIPTRVFELLNLTRLDLCGDNRKESPLRLCEIPSEIGQLTNLESLNILKNTLSTLPESLSRLTRLQDLNLQSNNLLDLPAGIGYLRHLSVRCVEEFG